MPLLLRRSRLGFQGDLALPLVGLIAQSSVPCCPLPSGPLRRVGGQARTGLAARRQGAAVAGLAERIRSPTTSTTTVSMSVSRAPAAPRGFAKVRAPGGRRTWATLRGMVSRRCRGTGGFLVGCRAGLSLRIAAAVGDVRGRVGTFDEPATRACAYAELLTLLQEQVVAVAGESDTALGELIESRPGASNPVLARDLNLSRQRVDQLRRHMVAAANAAACCREMRTYRWSTTNRTAGLTFSASRVGSWASGSRHHVASLSPCLCLARISLLAPLPTSPLSRLRQRASPGTHRRAADR